MAFASMSRELLILTAIVTMPDVRDTGMTGLDGRAAKVSKACAVSFKASDNLQAKSRMRAIGLNDGCERETVVDVPKDSKRSQSWVMDVWTSNTEANLNMSVRNGRAIWNSRRTEILHRGRA